MTAVLQFCGICRSLPNFQVQDVPFKTQPPLPKKTRAVVQKVNKKPVNPRVIDSSSLLCEIPVKVILVARPLLHLRKNCAGADLVLSLVHRRTLFRIEIVCCGSVFLTLDRNEVHVK